MGASLWNKEFYPIKRKYIDESKVSIYISTSSCQVAFYKQTEQIYWEESQTLEIEKFSIHNAVSGSRVKYYKTILGKLSLPWNCMACKIEVKSSAL